MTEKTKMYEISNDPTTDTHILVPTGYGGLNDKELQAMEDQNKMFQDFSKRTETEAEMLERMNRQNKEAVQRLKNARE